MGLASLTGILTVMATTMSGILAREVCYHEYSIGCFTDNAPGNALPQSPAHQQVKSESIQEREEIYSTTKITHLHCSGCNEYF